jgi:hypothetical protein
MDETRRIAERMRMGRRTVAGILAGDPVPKRRKASIASPYERLIAEWYQATPSLMAKQVLQRLRGYGYTGGYTMIKLATSPWRKKRQEAFFELEFLPGEEAQVDWMEWKVGGEAVYGFVYVLAWSRHAVVRFYPRHSLEFFLDGHVRAFHEIGGVAHRHRYDNLKSVVLRRSLEIQYNSMTTTTLSELWREFRLLQTPEAFSEPERTLLERFLREEHRGPGAPPDRLSPEDVRNRPAQLLDDFDWTFNPKIPRDKIMEFIQTDFLKKPSNLVLVGAAGVGKTHLAAALCHQAVLQGRQTVFLTLFDFTARLAKAKNPYSLIEYYAKVPLLCLDELGYVVPNKDQADAFFQIISKRSEVRTTIVTTNLIPSQWGKIFDSVTASAILDRLSMNGRFIICEGRSYRSKK